MDSAAQTVEIIPEEVFPTLELMALANIVLPEDLGGHTDVRPERMKDAPKAKDVTIEEMLSFFKHRVLVKPTPAKRKRKRTPEATGSGEDDEDGTQTNKKKGKKTKKAPPAPKPAWMKEGAQIDDLIPILRLSEEDVVYVEISDAPAPYNEYSSKVVKQLLRLAKRLPSICTEFNVLSLKYYGKTYEIPLNGRSAPRGDGAKTQRRAMDAMNALAAIGCIPKMALLKDIGYGSNKAKEYLTMWAEGGNV
jgi:hypothetical protein